MALGTEEGLSPGDFMLDNNNNNNNNNNEHICKAQNKNPQMR